MDTRLWCFGVEGFSNFAARVEEPAALVVVSRPLEGQAPTIDVAVGYSKSNTSPILKLFLSRLDELVAPNQKH